MSGAVVGLDLSLTSTGIAIVKNFDIKVYAVKTKPANFESELDRYGCIAKEICKRLQKGDLVFIEDYAQGPSAGSNIKQAELGGIVKLCIKNLTGYAPLKVHPMTLKKFAVGKGNVGKDEVRLAVYKKWGVEYKTNDEVDAYAIARLGLCMVGIDDYANKSQVQCGDKVFARNPGIRQIIDSFLS